MTGPCSISLHTRCRDFIMHTTPVYTHLESTGRFPPAHARLVHFSSLQFINFITVRRTYICSRCHNGACEGKYPRTLIPTFPYPLTFTPGVFHTLSNFIHVKTKVGWLKVASRPSRSRVSNDLLSIAQSVDFYRGRGVNIHPCLGNFLTFVPYCLTGLPARCKFFHQQTSSTSVAYTLLGGFMVAVRLPRALPDIQNCLMAFKYSLISLIIKEKVRCHENQ
jgi:hypothetical protein